MKRTRESRPNPAKVDAAQISMGTKTTTIVPPVALEHPKAIAPAYAVLLHRRDGAWIRQLYVSLKGAQSALERAERNGREAHLQLVELVPVPSRPVIVVGGGDDE